MSEYRFFFSMNLIFFSKENHFISINEISETMRSLFSTLGWGDKSVNVRFSVSTFWLNERRKNANFLFHHFLLLWCFLTRRRSQANFSSIIVLVHLNYWRIKHDGSMKHLNKFISSISQKEKKTEEILGAMGRILLWWFFKIIPAGRHESGTCGAPIL